ncbi:hypothetical protein L228DRAFT_167168 [Xylona heveae TC161]|uniref:Uncharacterized protein n=1 Tax=Xylona heveae (strain CBS 132557 / TC161) TaxID=1328760 RepID=A0A165FM70_XYLHT|nr:hypothetical protein L228DRAFT_167168 [Xylona heveae TC161]KZF21145.1 hypothetical protein L228DRAFT_167168 [Xylona heveae TC161]
MPISKRALKSSVNSKQNANAGSKVQSIDPFSEAPAKLTPFLDTLDPSKFYITHVENLPWKFKRKAFSVPVLMNVAIIAVLIWRIVSVYPVYAAIIKDNNKLNPSAASWPELSRALLRRSVTFFIDFALLRFILPWPLSFFFARPASAVAWRRRVGFQDQEVVVRTSRRWDREERKKAANANDPSVVSDVLMEKRILPAIDRRWMEGRTSLMLLDKNWDLDYGAMITATDLVDMKELDMEDFQKTVFMHTPKIGWLAWNVHKLDEGSEEEARGKLIAFKDQLTLMGKENLFFRWIEIIQYESSQPGGFTPERQTAAMVKAKALFESQGVDFEEFTRSIGGLEGVPGFEKSK